MHAGITIEGIGWHRMAGCLPDPEGSPLAVRTVQGNTSETCKQCDINTAVSK